MAEKQINGVRMSWQIVYKEHQTGFVIYPVGMLVEFGNLLPYAVYCNGGELCRLAYKDLYKVIGTLYGSGDGYSTFNTPNFAGEVNKT